ncbi:Formimidoyltransferase-cyclodeaminase [Nymphon striatum]|nr:Formimidoyltransferase-cyclodeaminase [Nymphon striatum]
MPKIVECVPNFSEGKDVKIIDAISNAIRSTDGVSLLDVDPGPSSNRTVYTFLGSPDAVVEGALNAARVAYKLIDMTKHKGEHPRLGALDVCPFIPVQGVEDEECIYCAKKFGEKLSAELKVPVYLYGYASTQGFRTTVPQIRKGEYDGLPDKLSKTEWKPDYGPTDFVPRWGATITGARKFLIAYNVNILSTKEQAHRIALNIREQGRGPESAGKLKNCQAIGWYLDEFNLAQVSINLTDHSITPMHVAYEEVCKNATELKLAVTGSQVVGLVPLKALLQAAEFYIKKENLFILEEDQKVHLAVNRLGLNSLGDFDPKKRIIEYMLPNTNVGPLASKTLEEFILNVAARTPAPGGGSVAATVAALGSALGAMVGQMTYGKRQWEAQDEQMRRLIPVMHNTMKEQIKIIDSDTTAFNDYMAALKLPKETEEEIMTRDVAMQAGLKKAISVPMSLAKSINKIWAAMLELAEFGNIGTKSDIQVGTQCLLAGIRGAYYNVKINLDGILDSEYREMTKAEIEQELKLAEKKSEEVLIKASERKD